MAECIKCRSFNLCPWATPPEIICSQFKPTVQTNADRIRGMDDVGLAAWYCHDRDCRGCEFGASDGCHLGEWLKAPAEVQDG